MPRTNTRQQLRCFKEALVEYGDDVKTIPKDWVEAFVRLRKVLSLPTVLRDAETGRRVIFLDELPWMDTAKSDFRSALDFFWNSWASAQKDLILVVCGSTTSWMISNLVRDTGGFYNRVTRPIHLAPFTLHECEQLLLNNGFSMTRRQIIECYMIFGGIPFYFNLMKPQLSLAQNVDMLFFRENSPLRSEYNQLFSSLFKNDIFHVRIVETMAERKSGLTRQDLIQEGLPRGKELTKCLEELEQCGFIRKYTAFTKKPARTFYQLVDALTLFHLTWIQNKPMESWMTRLDLPSYYAWCGLSFERVCLLHSRQIKSRLGILGISSQEYSWRSEKTSPGTQIDMLIDRKDDVINLCEIKYSSKKYAIDASGEEDLIYKRETFRKETGTSKTIHLTMITMEGLQNNECRNLIINEITGDDLFRDLM